MSRQLPSNAIRGMVEVVDLQMLNVFFPAHRRRYRVRLSFLSPDGYDVLGP